MNDDRQERILDILKDKKYISLEYLIESLHYSESTIRRDLRKLEKLGLIKRSPGGISLIREDLKENPLVLKSDTNKEQKNYIAEIALDFIEDFNTIFLDSSSTSFIFAKQLVKRSHLTILTTNLNTALLLNSLTDHSVYIIGGHLQDGKVDGGLAEDMLRHFTIDISFVSCRGFDKVFGASDKLESEAMMKRGLKEKTHQLVLLADDSKFNKRFIFQSITIDDIDQIISNKKPSTDITDVLDRHNIEFIY